MRLPLRTTAIAASLALGVSLLSPKPAEAMSSDVRAVLVAGTYGLLGGTAAGLATWPLTQDPRSIWIGSSIGLYLGLVVGVFYILNRDDPENPLAPNQTQSAVLPGEAFAQARADLAEWHSTPGLAARRPDLQLNFRVVSF